jgi:hypothetical protein
MSKTVREAIVQPDPDEMMDGLEFFAANVDDPILDATVYGLCETCGGSREVGTGSHYAVEGVGKLVGLNEIMAPCPDCQRISIVTKELRERADDAICAVFATHRTGFGAAIRAELRDAVLSTVLGKTRVAKEVYERVVELRTQVRPRPMTGTVSIVSGTVKYSTPKPCTVAVLEDSDDEG